MHLQEACIAAVEDAEAITARLHLEIRPALAVDHHHIAEELWQALGHATTLAYEPWPEFDEDLAREALLEIPVQVNGKLRGRIKAISAHGRMTGSALTAIPVAVGVMMCWVNPAYAQFFIHDDTGKEMLGAAVALQLIGYGVIRKIVSIGI